MSVKLGIMGCQSIHAQEFATLFNVIGAFPGWRVEYLLADDAPERLELVATTGDIPNICQSPDELIDNSDVVLITYRDSRRHYAPAKKCIISGKSVFVDKPFTYSIEEAADLVKLSLTGNAVLCGGSTLTCDPLLVKAKDTIKRSAFGFIAYRADFFSDYGGYRFYGSHLTDLCAEAFGTNALKVRAVRKDDKVDTTVIYPQRTVVLHSQREFSQPCIIFNTNIGLDKLEIDEKECYKNGMTDFVNAVLKGEADISRLRRLEFSVNLLDSILRSLVSGQEVMLPKITLVPYN